MEAEKCTFFPLQLGLFSPTVDDIRRLSATFAENLRSSPIFPYEANKEMVANVLTCLRSRWMRLRDVTPAVRPLVGPLLLNGTGVYRRLFNLGFSQHPEHGPLEW